MIEYLTLARLLTAVYQFLVSPRNNFYVLQHISCMFFIELAIVGT